MIFTQDINTISLSVTELVSLAYPAGDIHVGGSSSPRVSASMKAQFLSEQGMSEEFLSDVSVSGALPRPKAEVPTFGEGDTVKENDYSLRLSDTVDGLLRQPDGTVTLYMLLPTGGYDAGGRFRMRAKARLRALGALYCMMHGETEIELSAVSLFAGSSRALYESEYATAISLREALEDLVRMVLPVSDFLFRHKTLSVPKAGEVCVPYPSVRDGQEELMRSTYRAIRKGKRLFVQAPTGIGKTISTLYPAVRALGNGHVDKIFYLTAKASTRREAFSAAGRLFHAGARLRTCVISAKDQVCLCDKKGGGENLCNPFDCPYADGYYERAPHAVLSLLSKQNGYTRTAIVDAAKEYSVCPYELSLDLSEKCDIIICDYNYVFDPTVYFRRYFGEERTFDGKYAFLIDEGHNLADRARAMYSVSLTRNEVSGLLEGIPEGDVVLCAALKRFEQTFAELRNLCSDTLVKDNDGVESGFWMSREAPRFFDEAVEKLSSSLKDWLRNARKAPYRGEVSALRQTLRTYRLLRGYYDEKFLSMVRVRNGDVELCLFCLDPSAVLDECLSRAHSSIVFSATLTPLDYFVDLLGGGKKAEHLELPSPFPREHLCVAVCDGISTRFEEREKSYRSVASMIAATVSQKAGNYIVYFPSYAYLEAVVKRFSARYPQIPLIVQKKGMSYSEREAFLDSFRDDGKRRVGFCVLGGSFSEGVDLPGGRLIGTVIVGVGLPGLSEEGNILRDYYENKCENGYDYAYTFPGWNRVLQAAGRVIRTDEDEGVVVLIDDRYAAPNYKSLFPSHWEGLKYAGNSSSLAEILRRFWEKRKNSH